MDDRYTAYRPKLSISDFLMDEIKIKLNLV